MEWDEAQKKFLEGLPLKTGGMELRHYQVQMALKVVERGNSLVIMPTALGKTFVAALVMGKFLQQIRDGTRAEKKMLFLTPTKPLAGQQANRLRELLVLEGKTEDIEAGKKKIRAEEVLVMSGETTPATRQLLWKSPVVKIVCATPQTVEFDMLANRVDLADFGLVIFDEVHRAVKEHSYAFLAQEAGKRGAVLLGMTASPSSKREVIEEICRNLSIQHIELRDEKDADVAPYSNEIKMNFIFVDLPKDFKELRGALEELLKDAMDVLKEMGVVDSADLKRHKRALLEARKRALDLARTDAAGYQALSIQARAMNISHALDLLETEGIHALSEFMKEMAHRPQKSKAVKTLLDDFRWKVVGLKVEELQKKGIEHPKFARMKAIVSDTVESGKSAIVFAHYRNTVDKIVEELGMFAGVKPAAFVGHGKEGMNQKKQAQVLQDFKDGKYNVLVATSVAEEGIDVPSVDLVVFFEAVPSEIRAIQRRGRTGRQREGNTVVLITRGSKDEAFFWISKRREKTMKDTLHDLKDDLAQKEAQNKEAKGQGSTADADGLISTQDQDELISGSQTKMFDF